MCYKITHKTSPPNRPIIKNGPKSVILNPKFKTPKCRLCTMERLFILELSVGKKTKLINSRSEIYGACRQNPKLHRFNTDDPTGEKVKTTINPNVRNSRPLYIASRRESLSGIPPLYCQTITV